MDEASPIRILRPAVPGPWVFASPHSGKRLPGDFQPAPDLGPASLRSAEDTDMDRLAEPGVALGAVLIVCEVSRAHVDVNRAPDELDAELIEGAPGGGGPRAEAGYGVIPRLTGDGRRLRERRLTLEQARSRLAAVHRPYHEALEALMTEARDRHGRAVLVDWHSMPASAGGPDVVLGDRHGSSCGRETTRRLRAAFERRGWTVALNHPYAGGYATRLWGRPPEGFEAIQVEIDRGLYLDEATRTPSRGWDRTATIMAKAMAELIGDGRKKNRGRSRG